MVIRCDYLRLVDVRDLEIIAVAIDGIGPAKLFSVCVDRYRAEEGRIRSRDVNLGLEPGSCNWGRDVSPSGRVSSICRVQDLIHPINTDGLRPTGVGLTQFSWSVAPFQDRCTFPVPEAQWMLGLSSGLPCHGSL